MTGRTVNFQTKLHCSNMVKYIFLEMAENAQMDILVSVVCENWKL